MVTRLALMSDSVHFPRDGLLRLRLAGGPELLLSKR